MYCTVVSWSVRPPATDLKMETTTLATIVCALIKIIMSNESPLVKLLGPSLLSKVGTKVSTADAFRGKELVILYFSGNYYVEVQS